MIKDNIKNIWSKIEMSCHHVERSLGEVELVCVTKTVDIPEVEQAISSGIEIVGENRVKEMLRKYEILGDRVRWHMIGHLQTNKVKYIIPFVELIHSVDSLKLAQIISQEAMKINKMQNILVEVNVSQEDSKYGVRKDEVLALVREIADLPHVNIQGFMTMAPFIDDQDIVRSCFRKLRELRDEIRALEIANVQMKYLSMGMSNDYAIAVEEGANLVRIGSAVFKDS